MRKILSGLLLAVALLVASSCDDSEHEGVGTQTAVPVSFSSRAMDMLRDTRAGRIGGITTDVLKQSDVGFGVFAYFTDQLTWSAAKGAATPNFMYNQQVAWLAVDDDWGYTPLKYWPNDTSTGAVDDQTGGGPATGSHDGGRVSFFAYAPFVDLTPGANPTADAVPTNDTSTPEESRNGITAVVGNEHAGTPQLSYRLDPDHARQVDLLWGARGKDVYMEADGTPDTDAAALVNSDLRKQTTSEHVDFAFKHALACIDVMVQRVYDEVTFDGKKPDTDATRIYVSELKLDVNASLTGRFDLSTGQWVSTGPPEDVTFTISNNRIPADLRGTMEPNTSLASVQTIELDDFARKYGVNDTLKLLTELATTTLLIPRDDSDVEVTPTITYSFVTQDNYSGTGDGLDLGLPNSSGTHRYARIVNEVTGTAPVAIGTEYEEGGIKKYRVEAGKRYILVCYIGVEHVSFRQIAVEDWDFPLRFVLTGSTDYTEDTIAKGLNEE